MSGCDWAGLHSYSKLKCASGVQSEINFVYPLPTSRLLCAWLCSCPVKWRINNKNNNKTKNTPWRSCSQSSSSLSLIICFFCPSCLFDSCALELSRENIFFISDTFSVMRQKAGFSLFCLSKSLKTRRGGDSSFLWECIYMLLCVHVGFTPLQFQELMGQLSLLTGQICIPIPNLLQWELHSWPPAAPLRPVKCLKLPPVAS